MSRAITRTIITILIWRFLGLWGLLESFLRGLGGGLVGAKLFRQRLIESLKIFNDRCWGVTRRKTIRKSFVAQQPRNQEWNQPTLGHLPYLVCVQPRRKSRGFAPEPGPSVHLAFKFAQEKFQPQVTHCLFGKLSLFDSVKNPRGLRPAVPDLSMALAKGLQSKKAVAHLRKGGPSDV
jgi:hypothetical protein